MSIDLVNHEIEINKYKDLIGKREKTFVIFSKKGVGKTSFIQYVSGIDSSRQYVDVSAKEISLENHATDYFYIMKLIECINKSFPNNYVKTLNLIKKDLPFDASFSINVFFTSINIEPKFKMSVLKRLIIGILSSIKKPLYIHIENTEKIDKPSLLFFLRMIKEIDDIIVFFECIDKDYQICQALNEQFVKHSINAKFIEIKKLDWLQVKIVLNNLSIITNDEDKEVYEQSDGNIKTLIFNHQIDSVNQIDITVDHHFILNYLLHFYLGTTISEMFFVFQKYDLSLAYRFSVVKLEKHLDFLLKKGLVFTNDGQYYLTEYGIKNANSKNEELITSIISNYYLPIIESKDYCNIDKIIKGIRILIMLYLKQNDSRINRIIPYIEVYLLPLHFNSEIINEVYEKLNQFHGNDAQKIKLILIRIYIHLGAFQSANKKLSRMDSDIELRNILYATTLVHLNPYDNQTEKYILYQMKSTKSKRFFSALYTCLISLYMRIKSTQEINSFISNIDTSKIQKIDYYIIRKNLSIYSNNVEAIVSLKKIYRFFRENNNQRLLIATGITLATRYAQSGKLKSAKRIICIIERNYALSEEDQAYIDNNLSVVEILSNQVTEITRERLINTFYFCEDEYSRLLVANNLVIYYVIEKEAGKAQEYVQFIEDVGFEKYRFDEYLHLSYLNLIFYYNSVNLPKKNYYLKKINTLSNDCFSMELKKYIDSFLKQKLLNSNDKWSFLSNFKFRPAFMGHWIVNNFDY